MDTEELRDALERAGLTGYQSEAYLTLLNLGVAPAVDVAKQSSVPMSQIYKVLGELEDKGYAETLDRERLHARPRDPVEVLNDLRSFSDVLDEAADEIEDRWREPYQQEHQMSVVKHQTTIYDRVRSALAEAEYAIELVATVDQLQQLLPAVRDALESDIIVRLSLYMDDGLDAVIDELTFDGAPLEVRECDIPGPFLAVVDRRHTFFAPNDRSRDPYGVIINDEILSFIFHWYFQTCLWAVQRQIHTARDGPLPYISIEEFIQDFITLWEDGAVINVVAHGWDNNQQCMRAVRGNVSNIWFTGSELHTGRPPLEQLAGLATVELEVDGHPYTIGGWGAVFEDMEAYELIVDDITFADMDSGQPAASGSEEPVDPPSGDLTELPFEDVPESGL